MKLYPVCAALCFFCLTSTAAIPQLPVAVRDEAKPGRRVELALSYAGQSVDEARTFYQSGEFERMNGTLSLIAALTDECLAAAAQAHKAKYWKLAEVKTGLLSRRLHSLADDVDVAQRESVLGVAEHVDTVRDRCLTRIMEK